MKVHWPKLQWLCYYNFFLGSWLIIIYLYFCVCVFFLYRSLHIAPFPAACTARKSDLLPAILSRQFLGAPFNCVVPVIHWHCFGQAIPVDSWSNGSVHWIHSVLDARVLLKTAYTAALAQYVSHLSEPGISVLVLMRRLQYLEHPQQLAPIRISHPQHRMSHPYVSRTTFAYSLTLWPAHVDLLKT